jgi:hypothetical protein
LNNFLSDNCVLNKKVAGGNRVIYYKIAIDGCVTLNSRQHTNRVLPLHEPGMPRCDLSKIKGAHQRIIKIGEVIDWLDVETSLRYKPENKTTYCNIYAYDVAFLLGAYIPRLWWHEGTLQKILKGNKLKTIYGETIFEQNCNALVAWFNRYGYCFGWVRVFDITKLQTAVNKGTIGVIVAKNKNIQEPGHIVIIVPESISIKARWESRRVISPLQSQAGARNSKYNSGNNWWENEDQFIMKSFWVWKM